MKATCKYCQPASDGVNERCEIDWTNSKCDGCSYYKLDWVFIINLLVWSICIATVAYLALYRN